MILNTDKQKTSLKGVYVFYSVIITLCIHAVPMPPDINTETMTETEKTYSEETASTVEHDGAIDTYLTLLIETDEELKNDPSVDTSSPSYTNLLNERIGMKLDAMSKRINHSDND